MMFLKNHLLTESKLQEMLHQQFLHCNESVSTVGSNANYCATLWLPCKLLKRGEKGRTGCVTLLLLLLADATGDQNEAGGETQVGVSATQRRACGGRCQRVRLL